MSDKYFKWFLVLCMAGIFIQLSIGVMAGTLVAADYYSTHIAQEHQNSPAYHGYDYSLLKSVDGHTDNLLIAVDREPDGNAVIAKGYGCGRYFSVEDTNGSFGGVGKREVECNLKSHWTIEIGNGNSPASIHD